MKQTHYIRCLIVNNTFHDQLPVSFCGSLFSEDQVLCSTNVQSQSHGIYTEPTKENYTGVETTPFWNYFFLPFLTKTKREQPLPGHFYGKICLGALRFWSGNFDPNLAVGGGKLNSSCQAHIRICTILTQ